MNPEQATQLTQQARAILRANDRGGYTVPTAGLYPFQWNWDAAVTALGWITFDEPRAWDEFAWLLKGQWHGGVNDGFIAHITFHRAADSYFPGPEEWGLTNLSPPTSSISQPPLHATMLRWMWQRARDKTLARERLRGILPAIARHHLWWYRTRDPGHSGLVMSVHPWETGRDNSPAWDGPLARVPRTTRPYRRRDLDHVDARQRPSHEYYDRVVWLMDFMRDADFDPAVITRECPFRVVDAAIVFILHRATRDLLALAAELGVPIDDERELGAAVQRTTAQAGALWSNTLGMFTSLDLVGGTLIEEPVVAGFLSWYAGIGSPAQGNAQASTPRHWLDEVAFGVPSTRAGTAHFEPQRYWRGPVWQHINLLIAAGLEESGYGALAEKIKTASDALFDRSGFHEYYDPTTGAGLGGTHFSWTSATWLHWLGG